MPRLLLEEKNLASFIPLDPPISRESYQTFHTNTSTICMLWKPSTNRNIFHSTSVAEPEPPRDPSFVLAESGSGPRTFWSALALAVALAPTYNKKNNCCNKLFSNFNKALEGFSHSIET